MTYCVIYWTQLLVYIILLNVVVHSKLIWAKKMRMLLSVTCLLIFGYYAYKSLAEYLSYNTLSKLSKERQEEQLMPQICFSSPSLAEKRLQKKEFGQEKLFHSWWKRDQNIGFPWSDRHSSQCDAKKKSWQGQWQISTCSLQISRPNEWNRYSSSEAWILLAF